MELLFFIRFNRLKKDQRYFFPRPRFRCLGVCRISKRFYDAVYYLIPFDTIFKMDFLLNLHCLNIVITKYICFYCLNNVYTNGEKHDLDGNIRTEWRPDRKAAKRRDG